MTISGFVAYVKQLWKNLPDRSTPVTAERLLHVENGIKGNSDAIEKLAAAVVSQIVNDPNKIASLAALYAVNQKVTQQGEQITQLNSEMKTIAPNESKLQSNDSKVSIYRFNNYVFWYGETDQYKFELFFDGNSLWARRTDKSTAKQESKNIVSFG